MVKFGPLFISTSGHTEWQHHYFSLSLILFSSLYSFIPFNIVISFTYLFYIITYLSFSLFITNISIFLSLSILPILLHLDIFLYISYIVLSLSFFLHAFYNHIYSITILFSPLPCITIVVFVIDVLATS